MALGLGLDYSLAVSPGLTALKGELAAATKTLGFGKQTRPWANAGGNSGVNSAFFPYLTPDPNLWNKLVPYRLLVIDTAKGNQVVGGGNPSEVKYAVVNGATLDFFSFGPSWEFRLPITPQQLSITDTYSINTSATLRGILEEHSGVRFKNIAIQGTFGVWPGRPAIVDPPGTPSVLQSVFGGTIEAAQNVATQFQSVINAATTGSLASKPVTITPGSPKDSENGYSTGYFQTLMLTQFLEQYAEAKRDPTKASWRLVFDIIKQNQSFVVTPVAFSWNENVNRPMEINYNLQFKAWRRIDLDEKLTDVSLKVTPLSPGVLQKILNTIQAAQNTAAASYNLIGSVRSDVNNILNIVRQTGVFVKQLAGVALAASDLPAQLVGDIKSTVSQFAATVSPNNLFGSAATDPNVKATLGGIQGLANVNEGLSRASVSGGQLGGSAANSASLNPSNAPFASPLQNPLFFSQIPVNSLTLNTAQQNALQKELDSVNSFTVSDLKTMRGTILTMTTQLSNSFGAGNAFYSKLYNQPLPLTRTEPMTLDEYNILQTFYELIEAYDVLTATNQLDDQQILNNMEYVSALAATSQIPFSITESKIQVPVPFGLNMEQIASRYLGDPQRWLEIATLNELREPYIDETGFTYSLLSNADGRNIVVGNNTDLHIGQTVSLYSNTQSPTSRTISNITQLSQTSFLIALDGLANLSVFTVADQAYMQAYLPGTVNSQNVIFVPSSLQSPVFDQINIPSSVANVDLVGLSKVDLLLTPTGDLAITNTGDFRLAAGIPNLIQALAIKFGTQQKTSLLNPNFGLGIKAGTMNADIKPIDIYNQISSMVTADPRFSAITGLQVTLNGPSLLVSLGIQLSGISGVFPVSFTLPTTQ